MRSSRLLRVGIFRHVDVRHLDIWNRVYRTIRLEHICWAVTVDAIAVRYLDCATIAILGPRVPDGAPVLSPESWSELPSGPEATGLPLSLHAARPKTSAMAPDIIGRVHMLEFMMLSLLVMSLGVQG